MRHEDQRLLFRRAPARRLRHQPLDPRIGGVHGERLRAQRRFVRDRAPRRARRQTPAPGARDRSCRARRRRWPLPCFAPPSRPRSAACAFAVPARSIGMPTRGGKPPMSARRVALVHAGSGVPCARRASMLMSSGKSCGRSNCSNRKNPCASSSSGVALSSSTWRPEAGDRRDRAPGRVRRDVPADAADAAPHRPPAGRCRPRPPARSTRGRSISISIEITRAAMQLERIEVVAEIVRATSARRSESSSVNTW